MLRTIPQEEVMGMFRKVMILDGTKKQNHAVLGFTPNFYIYHRKHLNNAVKDVLKMIRIDVDKNAVLTKKFKFEDQIETQVDDLDEMISFGDLLSNYMYCVRSNVGVYRGKSLKDVPTNLEMIKLNPFVEEDVLSVLEYSHKGNDYRILAIYVIPNAFVCSKTTGKFLRFSATGEEELDRLIILSKDYFYVDLIPIPEEKPKPKTNLEEEKWISLGPPGLENLIFCRSCQKCSTYRGPIVGVIITCGLCHSDKIVVLSLSCVQCRQRISSREWKYDAKRREAVHRGTCICGITSAESIQLKGGKLCEKCNKTEIFDATKTICESCSEISKKHGCFCDGCHKIRSEWK